MDVSFVLAKINKLQQDKELLEKQIQHINVHMKSYENGKSYQFDNESNKRTLSNKRTIWPVSIFKRKDKKVGLKTPIEGGIDMEITLDNRHIESIVKIMEEDIEKLTKESSTWAKQMLNEMAKEDYK